MVLRDAIRVLIEQWADVRPRLSPDDGRLLIDAIRALTQNPDDEDLMLDIVECVAPFLPRDHPIFAAVALEHHRFTTTGRAWNLVIEELMEIVAASPW